MMQSRLVTTALVGLALSCGWVIMPEVWRATQLVASGDDPARRADLLLQDAVTAPRLEAALDEALRAEDDELAASLIAVAGEYSVAIPAAQRDRLSALGAGSTWRSLRDFGSGFAYGDDQSGAALSGALVGDVTGYGDLRDLYREGSKLAAGQSADTLVIGLAAAGLAVSAATWTSMGAALPARSGMTLVKAAQKAGRLSKPLMATLSRAAASAIDRQALAGAVAAVGRLELGVAWRGAVNVLRPTTLTTFRTLGQDAATLYSGTGQRGVRQVLALAHSGSEVTQAARIAVVKGSKTRAILALLGRSALIGVAISLTAAGWIMSFLWYLLGLAMLARRLGTWLGRKLRLPRRQPAATAATVNVQTGSQSRPAIVPPARPVPVAAPAFSRTPQAAPAATFLARRRRQRAPGRHASFPGVNNDKPLLGL